MRSASDDPSVDFLGFGTVHLEQKIGGKIIKTILKEVGYSPKLRTNLISLAKVQKRGISFDFPAQSTSIVAKFNDEVVMVGDSSLHGIVELIETNPALQSDKLFAIQVKKNQTEIIHMRLGHTPIKRIK